MTLKIMLGPGAMMPTRAHPWDAGMDLYTPVDVNIPLYNKVSRTKGNSML